MGIPEDIAALNRKVDALSGRLDELLRHLRKARLVPQATDGQDPDDGPTGE